MESEAAREEKLLVAKKKLRKYQKKKATNASTDGSSTSTRRTSLESTAATSTRRSSVTSDSGSVRTDGTSQEINTTVDENNALADVVSNNNEIPASQALPLTSHGSLVEGLQPITLPPGQQSQTDLLSNTIDSVPVENTISSGISGNEPFSFEALANICRMQQQTIALLVEEKTALASELEKYSAMADRFKSSEELLEEGQLLVDALRRQNSELEEKIRNGEDRLKDSDDQKKKIIESLQSQVFYLLHLC
ncbi:34019_t:CDS:2 [Racocetra persica]|uniref:34019_t:CDS:1 n=1 Tax=Racocetra persica TaxID=160502 RepID=A0ACA9MBL9_9GLOM|nr:34019_t:CDS:2 [Racocetra persica]